MEKRNLTVCNKPPTRDSQTGSFDFRHTIHKTHDTEQRIALNNGLNESSGFMSDTFGKMVKRESVKQLSATLIKLNHPKSDIFHRPCIKTRVVKKLSIRLRH